MVTPAGWREAAGHLQAAYKMSERRACRVLGVDRTSVRYQATRPDDGALRDRLRLDWRDVSIEVSAMPDGPISLVSSVRI